MIRNVNGGLECTSFCMDDMVNQNLMCRTVGDILCTREREINIDESWTLFEKITQAIQLLHQKGAIHRDVKPANILIGENGEVAILATCAGQIVT